MSANAADVSGGEPSREKQNSNSEQVVFDSKNIGKKPKAEYFVKVEGAEARKKAAIKAAEKKRDEARRSQKKAAFKQRIKAIPKKYKIIVIVATILLIAAIIFAAIKIPMSAKEKENAEASKRINESAQSFGEELNSRKGENLESLEEAMAWGEEQVKQTDDPHEKFDIYYSLASLAAEEEEYYDKALEYALKLEELAQNEAEYRLAYETIATVYNFIDDNENFEKFFNKAMEYEIEYEESDNYL